MLDKKAEVYTMENSLRASMQEDWCDLWEYHQLPLLFRAAYSGAWGQRKKWNRGALTDALFVYLEGEPEPESTKALCHSFTNRPLVCLSKAWESYIQTHYPKAACFQRYLMAHRKEFELGTATQLPVGFEVTSFDENIFSQHPFSHGENYPSFEDFQKSGSGAAILHDNRIVASASSFLSYQGEVELDVSTDAAFRRMGLATACVRQMLFDCQRRGITVHWDAQNKESRHLAEKFGFQIQKTYSVYVIMDSTSNC